jgi:hypothetical protein
MVQKAILRLQLPGLYVLPFSAFLLALARYSYRAKELLVCWLFFCFFFAVVALTFLGIGFAYSAVHHFLKWLSVVKAVIPELAVALAEVPEEPVSAPPVLAAATLNLSLAPCAPRIALNSASCLRIELAPSSEDDVRY